MPFHNRGTSSRTLWDHVLLIGTFNSNLNNVVWSLVHEMRISLIFPLVMFLLVRSSFFQSIGLAIGLSASSVMFVFLAKPSFWGTEWYATVHYTAIFIIGAVVAKHREYLQGKLLRVSLGWKIGCLLLGIGLYLYIHPSFVLSVKKLKCIPYSEHWNNTKVLNRSPL
jgi:peptidoglycan/LPS O-acetylase OafA/YrhL